MDIVGYARTSTIEQVAGFEAQFEREMMLKRQREGIAKAKAQGKYRGRKPIPTEKREKVLRLAASGKPKSQIAREVGIGEATVYRILASARPQLVDSPRPLFLPPSSQL